MGTAAILFMWQCLFKGTIVSPDLWRLLMKFGFNLPNGLKMLITNRWQMLAYTISSPMSLSLHGFNLPNGLKMLITNGRQMLGYTISSPMSLSLQRAKNTLWTRPSLKLGREHPRGIWIIWAPSSEFVSSSIPSWQILTAHAQPFKGARDLAFCLKVPLDSLLVWASREGSGKAARMRSLAWTFAARIGDKYQIHLTRSILFLICTVCQGPKNERLVIKGLIFSLSECLKIIWF